MMQAINLQGKQQNSVKNVKFFQETKQKRIYGFEEYEHGIEYPLWYMQEDSDTEDLIPELEALDQASKIKKVPKCNHTLHFFLIFCSYN